MNFHQEDVPFELGTTLKGTATLDGTTSTVQEKVLGSRCVFQDIDYSATGLTSGRPLLSSAKIVAIALRNTSGITLLPKRLGLLDLTAGRGQIKNVDGYAHDLLIGPCVLIDPWLPAAGVADDDIFWGIIKGPALMLTPFAGADFNGDIAAGAPLVAATGTTSGNTTGGRVSNVTLPGQTGATAAFSAAANLVGYAMSARTTGVTHADILVNFALRI